MHLLRAIVATALTDVRSLTRERYQMVALVLPLLLGIGLPAYSMSRDLQRAQRRQAARQASEAAATQGQAATQTVAKTQAHEAQPLASVLPAPWRAYGVLVVRWVMLLATGFVSFLVVTSIGATLGMAAFAGQRDGRTMELLLASPLSKGQVFLVKVCSPILVALVVAYVGLLLAATLVWWVVPFEALGLPVGLFAQSLLLALPMPVAVCLAVIGLAIMASVSAETVKGASQIFGFELLLVFFGPWVVGAAINHFELEAAALRWGKALLNWPFAAQYALVVGTPLALGAVMLGLAAVMFRRQSN